MNRRLFTLLLCLCAMLCGRTGFSQVNFTAKDGIAPYDGPFRPGCNLAYFPNWTTRQLADLAAGNPAVGVPGVGAKAVRPVLAESVLDIFGYDAILPDFEHFENLGMGELTATLAFPVDWHRDYNQYCPGEPSALFANLYEPIWDGGANGTPINENNYFALYVWKTVNTYNEYVRFWEIWNEPGFDETGNTGWREPGDPIGNWWDRNPEPCEYILKAPIFHYVRTMRIAYDVIKTIAPEDYVVVAGFGYQSFLDAVLRNTDNPNDGSVTSEYPHGGGAYFDIMGLHAYPHFDGSTTNYDANFFARHSDAAADGLLGRRDYYQEVLSRYGYDGITYPKKQTIVTEINVPREFNGGDAFFASTEGQRNYIIKVLIKAKLNQVHQIHVFGLSDQPGQPFGFDVMGLYKDLNAYGPYNQIPNDEAWAYKTAADLLFNTTYDPAQTAAMNIPNGMRGHAFKNPDGSYVYAMWAETQIDKSESASINYSFPSNLNISVLKRRNWNFSQTGVITDVTGQNIQLTGEPVFFSDPAGDGGDLRPTVSLSTNSLNVNGPFIVDVAFSEDVTDLSLSDFEVSNGSLSNLSGSGKNYSIRVTHNSPGLLSIQLPASKAFDSINQGNRASNTLFVNYTVGGGGNVDLELSINASASQVPIYSNVSYTLRLRNAGGRAATGIEVEVPFPSTLAYVDASTAFGNINIFARKWQVGSLNAGEEATMTLELFTLSEEEIVTYAQVLSASPNDSDSSPGNGLCCVAVEDDEAAVVINGSGGGGGDQIPPTVTLSTASTTVSGAFAVTVNFSESVSGLTVDDFSVGNGTAGSLSGSGANYSLQVNPTAPGPINISLPASKASDASGNGNLASNALTVTYNVGGGDGIDLELSLAVSKTQFVQYENISYTLTLSNRGSEPATGVGVQFPLPSGMAYVSQNESQGQYFNWNGDWTVGSLAPGQEAKLDLTLFTLDDSAPIVNFAQVSAADQNDSDSSPNNNNTLVPAEDDEAAVSITPGSGGLPCVLNTSVSARNCDDRGTPTDGSDDLYTFTLNVSGSNTSSSWQATLPNADATNTTTVSQKNYGESLNLSYAVPDVNAFLNGAITIEVADAADSNCRSSLSVDVPNTCSTGGGNGVDLALGLAVDRPDFRIYENVTYTLQISNTGNEEATGIVVEFPLPTDLVYVDQILSAGSYDNWIGEWELSSLAAGETEFLELTLFTLSANAPITNFAQVVEADQDDADSTPDNNNTLSPNEDDEAAVTITPASSNNRNHHTAATAIRPTQGRPITIERLFPNPATDRLHLLFTAQESGTPLQVRLYNLLGNEVGLRQTRTQKGFNQLDFDLRALPEGVYYLLFDSANRHEPIIFVKHRL
ncbi:MAG: Ig-like domain-containing protein [Bacteroidota bacterium]